jgi:hypothetical protein
VGSGGQVLLLLLLYLHIHAMWWGGGAVVVAPSWRGGTDRLRRTRRRTNSKQLSLCKNCFKKVVFPRGTVFIRVIGDHHRNSDFWLALYSYTVILINSVADPDSYVFGPSGSISTRYGSGFGSFYHAKKVKKNFIPTVLFVTCLWLLYDFLSWKMTQM